MENDMIERVARALHAARHDPVNYPWFHSEADKRSLSRAMAVAAIEAMREPTGAQYEALSATDKMWREMDSKTVWQTYIDAALQPRAPITVS